MSAQVTQRDCGRRLLTLGCALALVLGLSGCWEYRAAQQDDSLKRLAMVVSGDTAGWIVPCGCTSNQSGGLLRRGSFLRALGDDQAVVYADVGGAASGTSKYDRTKFEAILAGELAMQVAAHNLGQAEAALGPEYLRDVASRLKVPFISCNVRDNQGKLLVAPLRMVEAGGRRIALVGVLSDKSSLPELQIDPPREAILNTLADARGTYDTVVVLAYLPDPELTALAESLPEADLVVGGPTGQSIQPRQIGPTLLASATNQGKFLAQFEFAPGVDRRCEARIIELDKQYADDAAQQKNLAEFYHVLSERDYSPADTSFVQPLAAGLPSDFRIAGSTSCAECHDEECAEWKRTGHGHAWKSLQQTGAQVDSFCQRCHVTGYGLPGGFVSAGRSSALASVGCESCHGPSQAHSEDPAMHTTYFGRAQHQCTICHDRENSPEFAYDAYWPRIEHGPSASDPTSEPATGQLNRKDEI